MYRAKKHLMACSLIGAFFGAPPLYAIFILQETPSDSAQERGFGGSRAGQRGLPGFSKYSAPAVGDQVQLEAKYGSDATSNDFSMPAKGQLHAAPVAYDPDKGPAFQKALRNHLMDQDLPQCFTRTPWRRSRPRPSGPRTPAPPRRGMPSTTASRSRSASRPEAERASTWTSSSVVEPTGRRGASPCACRRPRRRAARRSSGCRRSPCRSSRPST